MRHFCSHACEMFWRQQHDPPKQHRRSKLEIYLEATIRQTFPNLTLLCNDRQFLNGLELDFYFPELRFAIELNGIVHYEPIYGPESFEKVHKRDEQKILLCAELGIELAVIDSSTCKYLTPKTKEKYQNLTCDLIQQGLKRIS